MIMPMSFRLRVIVGRAAYRYDLTNFASLSNSELMVRPARRAAPGIDFEVHLVVFSDKIYDTTAWANPSTSPTVKTCSDVAFSNISRRRCFSEELTNMI
jgi:hypothetical protein